LVYGEVVEVICVGLVRMILLEKRVYWGGVYVRIVVSVVDDVRVAVAVIIAIDIIVIVRIAVRFVDVQIVDILRNIRRTHPAITMNRTVSGGVIIRVINATIHRILVGLTIQSIHRTHTIIIPRNNFHTALMRYRQPVHTRRVTSI